MQIRKSGLAALALGVLANGCTTAPMNRSIASVQTTGGCTPEQDASFKDLDQQMATVAKLKNRDQANATVGYVVQYAEKYRAELKYGYAPLLMKLDGSGSASTISAIGCFANHVAAYSAYYAGSMQAADREASACAGNVLKSSPMLAAQKTQDDYRKTYEDGYKNAYHWCYALGLLNQASDSRLFDYEISTSEQQPEPAPKGGKFCSHDGIVARQSTKITQAAVSCVPATDADRMAALIKARIEDAMLAPVDQDRTFWDSARLFGGGTALAIFFDKTTGKLVVVENLPKGPGYYVLFGADDREANYKAAGVDSPDRMTPIAFVVDPTDAKEAIKTLPEASAQLVKSGVLK